jgi:hypothetical protein
MLTQDLAATQEGSLILLPGKRSRRERYLPRSSAAARSPLGNVVRCSYNVARPCKNRPVTATGPTPTTCDGCFGVGRVNQRLHYCRLAAQFRSIGCREAARRFVKPGLYGLCGHGAGENNTNHSEHSEKVLHRTYSLRSRGALGKCSY